MKIPADGIELSTQNYRSESPNALPPGGAFSSILCNTAHISEGSLLQAGSPLRGRRQRRSTPLRGLSEIDGFLLDFIIMASPK